MFITGKIYLMFEKSNSDHISRKYHLSFGQYFVRCRLVSERRSCRLIDEQPGIILINVSQSIIWLMFLRSIIWLMFVKYHLINVSRQVSF